MVPSFYLPERDGRLSPRFSTSQSEYGAEAILGMQIPTSKVV
jgi:hypothetical protein